LYFEELAGITTNYKAAANWIMGPVKSVINAEASSLQSLNLKAKRLAELIQLIDEQVVSNSVASQRIFPELLKKDEAPLDIAKRLNVVQESNVDQLALQIAEILARYPEKVEEYKNGKKGVIGLFMGDLMKVTQGKADPKVATQIFIKQLEA